MSDTDNKMNTINNEVDATGKAEKAYEIDKTDGTGNDLSFEKLSYEEAFALLEEKISFLEQGTLPLEKSMDAFKEGMELLNICEKKLDDFEGKLSKLVEENPDFASPDVTEED